MILLDTNLVVAHLNGHAAVTAKISSHIEEIAVPALVVAELDYGAKASTRPTENLARLSTFLQCVEVVAFDEAAAHQYGTLRAHLRTIGKPTGEIDVLICRAGTRCRVGDTQHARLRAHRGPHAGRLVGVSRTSSRAADR